MGNSISTDFIVAKLEELPTLPTIVYELSRLISDPMSSTNQVEKVMANDLSMTTKVLKLVNSAYYAIPGGVSTLSRALGYIGFDAVNQLVLSTSIFEALELKSPPRFEIAEFWKHAFGVAVTAETIAKFVRHPLPADLFICGLVHDMGKVALYTVDADTMLAIIDRAKQDDCTYEEAENRLEIPGHAVIGSLLAKRWNLPMTVQCVIKHHHNRDITSRKSLAPDINLKIDVVLLANILVHTLKYGDSGHQKVLTAPKEILERLTIGQGAEFATMLKGIKENLDKAADFLRLIGEKK